VLYTFGGAGEQTLTARQLRFGNTLDQFAKLLEAIRNNAKTLPNDTRVGIAPHLLRATNPADLANALPLANGNPIHIHVAEQPKEVADISAWLGARPVEWLLANTSIGPNWCAIHATHMTSRETAALAKSGAVAGLCPITEANLGDGPFNGPGWLAAGGAFGIGSDSNVGISLTEELRTLEYSQRLRDLSRNVIVPKDGSVGQFLYVGAALGGAQALGRRAGKIAIGTVADLTAIDLSHPTLCALHPDQILDGLAFAAPNTVITHLLADGRHLVRDGRHIHRDQIINGWRKAMKTLVDTI
jgi:formimidoylglutamate deiminase